ncbi:LOW QUALITY PROTEIN: apoptosis-inducing factor homolog B [Solanum pennellii]|uniref:LOW QUALITY PROTEIN: apoptosis-inducing factor homolog B n=1 Tax=Solanum pennellii TaxID=28526 RepID=A0ABM1FIH7_SOLPN|nr:LOW QUALITY PROTEIN: apoptosis-inducing factor homolog B [Solanum pennellii]
MENPPEWGDGGRGRRVVVIGGGIAGSLIAKSLQFDADLTLIDPKDYFEIPWASLRSTVEPLFAERSLIHHKDYLANGRLIVSEVTNITNKEVLTADGHQVTYDYLVVATGHYDPLPVSRTDRLEEYQTENEKIKEADSILIVGGGPTGVELAAEIAVDFPQKKVILVHDGSRLLEFIGPKASDKTLEWLKNKNVEVKLMQSVDLSNNTDNSGGNRTYFTSSGETIRADCHFLCTGKPPGSEWLRETYLKDRIDNFGRLKVDENLRIKGHRNIFAVGDITDIKELKQGYSAQKHALVAAKNLKLLMSGGKESKLTIYEPRSSPKIIVSLGRQDAVAQFSFTTIIGLVPGMIKSKDLYVGKTRKKMGLQPK